MRKRERNRDQLRKRLIGSWLVTQGRWNMAKLYKLTDHDGTTGKAWEYDGGTVMFWEEGKTNHVASSLPRFRDRLPRLCSPKVIHAYESLEQLRRHYDYHIGECRIDQYGWRLFEAEGYVVVRDESKVGVFSLTTTKELATGTKGSSLRRWLSENVSQGVST